MPLIEELGNAASLLVVMFGLMVSGITITAIGYFSYTITSVLSGHTKITESDPTVWKRTWSQMFEHYFDPFGKVATSDDRGPISNGVLYQLAIGIVVMAAILGAYILFSGATLGIMVVSYHSMGVVPNVTPIFDQLAAGCLLFGIAVIFHATEKRGASLTP